MKSRGEWKMSIIRKRDSSGKLAKYTKAERIAAFWGKVNHPVTECWIWTGATVKPRKQKYGQFYDGYKTVLAHRFAYELENGRIPKGLTIDHQCRTTLCVRPSHLKAMTLAENIRLGGNSQKTHCVRGHKFTKDNLVKLNKPAHWRECRKCKNRFNAEWRDRQLASDLKEGT